METLTSARTLAPPSSGATRGPGSSREPQLFVTKVSDDPDLPSERLDVRTHLIVMLTAGFRQTLLSDQSGLDRVSAHITPVPCPTMSALLIAVSKFAVLSIFCSLSDRTVPRSGIAPVWLTGPAA